MVAIIRPRAALASSEIGWFTRLTISGLPLPWCGVMVKGCDIGSMGGSRLSADGHLSRIAMPRIVCGRWRQVRSTSRSDSIAGAAGEWFRQGNGDWYLVGTFPISFRLRFQERA